MRACFRSMLVKMGDKIKSFLLRVERFLPEKAGRKKDQSVASAVIKAFGYFIFGLLLFYQFFLNELVGPWITGFYSALGVGNAYYKFLEMSFSEKFFIFVSCLKSKTFSSVITYHLNQPLFFAIGVVFILWFLSLFGMKRDWFWRFFIKPMYIALLAVVFYEIFKVVVFSIPLYSLAAKRVGELEARCQITKYHSKLIKNYDCKESFGVGEIKGAKLLVISDDPSRMMYYDGAKVVVQNRSESGEIYFIPGAILDVKEQDFYLSKDQNFKPIRVFLCLLSIVFGMLVLWSL